jgi:hypothetical protein
MTRSSSNYFKNYFRKRKLDQIDNLEIKERKEIMFQTELIKMKKKEDRRMVMQSIISHIARCRCRYTDQEFMDALLPTQTI